MKTKRIYVMRLNSVSNKKYCLTSGILRTSIEIKNLGTVLVRKNIFTCTDLNTDEKYKIGINNRVSIGEKFVLCKDAVPFSKVSNKNENFLSKKKILSIYNNVKGK